ncbi:MAG: leucine-rich repeat protein [Ruminococcus sp.]|nr:leucine-rich repeat protein [Ruminococcus sp.]
MKKTVSVFLSILMLVNSLFMFSFQAFAEDVSNPENVLEYEVMEDDTVKITRYDSLDITYNIPDEIDGKIVTVIGKKAFKECHALTNVTIPDTVTTIENQAFEKCDKLKTVVLGSSVQSLGYRAFAENKILTKINFPSSLLTIGNNCFIRCASLDNITIPNSVTSIGDFAFSDCTSIKNLTFENAELTIGEFAFGWCLKLSEISLGDKVNEIKSGAFVACDNVKSFTIKSENCVIDDSADTLPSNATIYAYEKSTAYDYAVKYEQEFEALEKPFEKVIGDSNLDNELTIVDATTIQRYLADIIELTKNALINADADEDSIVTVMDATKVQRILAQID